MNERASRKAPASQESADVECGGEPILDCVKMLLRQRLLVFGRLKPVYKFSKAGGNVHNSSAHVCSEQCIRLLIGGRRDNGRLCAGSKFAALICSGVHRQV